VHDLRIGCVHDLPLQRLQAFLGLLYQCEPDLRGEVMHLGTAEQLELLRAGGLDIGIVHDGIDAPGFEIEPLYPGEVLAAFLPIGHALLEHDSLGPSQLADQLLVVPPRAAAPALADWLVTRLAADGYRFRRIHETAGAHPRDVLLATAERFGITLAPASTAAVAGDVATLVARVALDPAPQMPDTVLAWRPGRPPRLASLVAVARELRAGH
jgi:hypothetical protein